MILSAIIKLNLGATTISLGKKMHSSIISPILKHLGHQKQTKNYPITSCFIIITDDLQQKTSLTNKTTSPKREEPVQFSHANKTVTA